MMNNGLEIIPLIETVTIKNYVDWLLNIIKITGMSLGSIILFIFIFSIVINVLIAMLVNFLPFLKGIVVILEYLMLPGSLMHMVWHVLALKRLKYPTTQTIAFGLGWSRTGIRLKKQLKSVREGIIFFWAPILNLPIIVGWVMPGAFLFQWLDTLVEGTVFYWIWFYVLISMLVFALPDIHDLFGPLYVSLVKVPEFYLFTVFYVIIAPTTLILWGWGITIIFSLLYLITAFYEIERISRYETLRLKLNNFDKLKTRSRETTISRQVIIVPEGEYTD